MTPTNRNWICACIVCVLIGMYIGVSVAELSYQ